MKSYVDQKPIFLNEKLSILSARNISDSSIDLYRISNCLNLGLNSFVMDFAIPMIAEIDLYYHDKGRTNQFRSAFITLYVFCPAQ